MEYYLVIKHNEIMPPAATYMGRETALRSELQQRKTNIGVQNDTNELVSKAETDSQISKSNLWLPKGKCRGRDKLKSSGLTHTHL